MYSRVLSLLEGRNSDFFTLTTLFQQYSIIHIIIFGKGKMQIVTIFKIILHIAKEVQGTAFT